MTTNATYTNRGHLAARVLQWGQRALGSLLFEEGKGSPGASGMIKDTTSGTAQTRVGECSAQLQAELDTIRVLCPKAECRTPDPAAPFK